MRDLGSRFGVGGFVGFPKFGGAKAWVQAAWSLYDFRLWRDRVQGRF